MTSPGLLMAGRFCFNTLETFRSLLRFKTLQSDKNSDLAFAGEGTIYFHDKGLMKVSPRRHGLKNAPGVSEYA